MNQRSDGAPALLVSVVIPAYNEQENIQHVYDALCSALAGSCPLEIIFVDDGSRDRTSQSVRELECQGAAARLIRFGRNFGQQAALLAGLQAACGAAVITMDCDLQHPPELLPKMIEAWRRGAKVVQMVRRQTIKASVFKRTTSQLFYRLINFLSSTPVTSGAADYQLLDRDVVNALLQFQDRNPFLRGLVAWLGFPSTTIEYVAPERQAGTSAYTTRRMLRLSVEAVMALSSTPLRLSFHFGLLTAMMCLLYAAYAIYEVVMGRAVQGWASVVVVVTFLGAVQLVSIGIVGEYIARVFEQTRAMPPFVVTETYEMPPQVQQPSAAAGRHNA